MENTQTNSPSEILEGNIKTEVKRVNMPIFKLVLLGILAGMFIAGGAAASNVAIIIYIFLLGYLTHKRNRRSQYYSLAKMKYLNILYFHITSLLLS